MNRNTVFTIALVALVLALISLLWRPWPQERKQPHSHCCPPSGGSSNGNSALIFGCDDYFMPYVMMYHEESSMMLAAATSPKGYDPYHIMIPLPMNVDLKLTEGRIINKLSDKIEYKFVRSNSPERVFKDEIYLSRKLLDGKRKNEDKLTITIKDVDMTGTTCDKGMTVIDLPCDIPIPPPYSGS